MGMFMNRVLFKEMLFIFFAVITLIQFIFKYLMSIYNTKKIPEKFNFHYTNLNFHVILVALPTLVSFSHFFHYLWL